MVQVKEGSTPAVGRAKADDSTASGAARRKKTTLKEAMAPAFALLCWVPPEDAGKRPLIVRGSRQKRIRDCFKFSTPEYALFDELKARSRAGGRVVKRGELVRAGLRLLAGLDEQTLMLALARIEPHAVWEDDQTVSLFSDPASASPTPAAAKEPAFQSDTAPRHPRPVEGRPHSSAARDFEDDSDFD